MAKKKSGEKKGLFSKAIDSVSARDEKAALEAAQKEATAAKAAAAQAAKEAARVKEEAAAAKAAAEKAEKAKKQEEMRKAQAEFREAHAEAAKPKFLAVHTVATGETLSHLADKYYGKTAKDYYMLIYEANKAVIGDNPNFITVGMKLNIPELPPQLK